MYIIKNILFLLFLSFGISQGRMNGFGIGHYNQNQGTSNAMDGIMDLTPSFIKNVSFSNPSTWHNLNFTYLSLSYGGNKSSFTNSSIFNGYSSLSNAIWIVPIKSKSSFGLSLSPYSDQRISLIDTDYFPFYAFNDTLIIKKTFDRFGGIMSFKAGTSYLVTEKLSLGINMNILFGSSRQNETINFSGSGIIQSSRIRYNGIINNLYISLIGTERSRLYTSTTFSIKPLEGVYEEKHLFDDANGNGHHDLSVIEDFPHPDSVSSNSEKKIINLHNPRGIRLGMSQLIGESSAFSIEFSLQQDNAKNINNVQLPINNWITNTNCIKTGFTKYPNNLSLKLIDKLSYKSGLIYSTYKLNGYNSNITELGFSLGIGFTFKTVGNQLDINYYIGNREFPNIIEKELIHQIQFGISLADIWFVKRRQK